MLSEVVAVVVSSVVDTVVVSIEFSFVTLVVSFSLLQPNRLKESAMHRKAQISFFIQNSSDSFFVFIIPYGLKLLVLSSKVHRDHSDDQKCERGLYFAHEKCRCEYKDGKNTVRCLAFDLMNCR